MSKCVEVALNGPLAVLRIHKPPVNALEEFSLRGSANAVVQVEQSPTVGAVIVASAVEGIFCPGGDLAGYSD